MDDSYLQIKSLQVSAEENAPQNWCKYIRTNAWSVLWVKNWTINERESNRLLLLNTSCEKFCIYEDIFRQKERKKFLFLLSSWALTKVHAKKMFVDVVVLLQEKKIEEKIRIVSLFWGSKCNFTKRYLKDDRSWYVLALNKGEIQ